MILVYRINNVYNLTAKVVGNARKHFPLLENYVSILEKTAIYGCFAAFLYSDGDIE
jgi:hypothetical protein